MNTALKWFVWSDFDWNFSQSNLFGINQWYILVLIGHSQVYKLYLCSIFKHLRFFENIFKHISNKNCHFLIISQFSLHQSRRTIYYTKCTRCIIELLMFDYLSIILIRIFGKNKNNNKISISFSNYLKDRQVGKQG